MSIILGFVFAYAWYSQLNLMAFYQLNNISTFTTTADFNKIGVVSLNEMKAIPFYGFYYKNKEVMRNDPVLCKDYGGDCAKFVQKFLKIKWLRYAKRSGK